MYVGRIVAVGISGDGVWVGYRVSSRSFPNRRATASGSSIFVHPLDPSDLLKNPYITYPCIRASNDFAVVSNGDHTDMIFDRIEDGSRPLDAVALSLVAYGYERDELRTPRIAGFVSGRRAVLGIAAHDEIRVRDFELQDGDAWMVATYEKTGFEPMSMEGSSASSIARSLFGLPFERPVCSAAAFRRGDGFELAVYNPR
ncbi:MAG: IMP cyclohydrolase [Methanothrix sp.]|uniref:IMP cyclohydrolase n=1 Tax=Methanothrix sp. TaxID=90426 RepID=UPI0025E9958E|nr:IMP cyclohydrolase [Methanothrix sp.]MCQ8902565.1 IMP cyclohydrolase [Methanothrix sp.]